MSYRKTVRLGLLLLAGAATSARAQETKNEFWPEFDTFVKHGGRIRVVFVDAFNQDQNTRNRQGSFSYFLDFALKPIFRRELREKDDVFRRRFLTFRAGYQFTTSFVSGDPSSERRAIAESTARCPLPGKFVVLDRNRGEFRFITGQPFSIRYRNRLWAERDVKLARLVFTPFAYGEIDYNTRFNAWTTNRYAAGIEFPVGPHVVIEPYMLRQNDTRANPRHLQALGLTFNLYF
jgi:hypothetical protein